MYEVCMGTGATAHMWRSGQLCELAFPSLLLWALGIKSRLLSLCGKHLYPRSHLADLMHMCFSLKDLFLFLCIWVFTCIYCTTWGCLQKSDEDIGPPGARVKERCESLCGLQNRTHILCKSSKSFWLLSHLSTCPHFPIPTPVLFIISWC